MECLVRWGGDSPENVKWMENCVAKIKGKPVKDPKTGKEHPADEGTAIAICKTTFMRMKGNKAKAEFILNQILGK